ncbi:hypothetical protein WMY93_014880 [Mugilogobius chulae]|uniref:NAD(P)(+)--arginine ADP-ribosyltransferase n=1 Tax=Mugilogobius chulae TaxID=88201 RepID=A0AAW0P5K4_9GOBI
MLLALMLCLVLPSYAMVSQQSSPFRLDMVPQSVDDMYQNCKPKMSEIVTAKYFPSEMKSNKLFENAWKKTEQCAKDKFSTRQNKKLSENEIHALCIYTANDLGLFKVFNDMVRTSGAKYTSNGFKYHTLHFWLTLAIQNINPNKQCRTTYRRTTVKFMGKVGQTIRFGSFTSTSTRTDVLEYGKETCFYVRTCLGAPIQDYSLYNNEAEVLVPPYEKFKITEIVPRSYKELSNCNTIFVLKHVDNNKDSKLNCKVAG